MSRDAKPRQSTKSSRDKISLSNLYPHPRQIELFGEIDPQEVQRLASQVASTRDLAPLEVTATGIVLVGFPQFLAANHAGITAPVPVLVRHDLLTEATVLQHLLAAGMADPRLDLLTMARCYAALKKNAREVPYDQRTEDTNAKVYHWMVKRYPTVKPRTISRYCRCLKAPVEVQHAFSQGKLNVKQLEAVAQMAPDVKRQIAEQIRQGGIPLEVVGQYITGADRPHRTNDGAIAALARSLTRALADFDGRVDGVKYWPAEKSLLDKGIALLTRIRDQAKSLVVSPAGRDAQLQRLVELVDHRGKNGKQPGSSAPPG